MSVPNAEPSSDGLDLGNVPVRLTLPEDLATFWCQLELLHADAVVSSHCPESFIAFLVAATRESTAATSPSPASPLALTWTARGFIAPST